MTGVKNFATRFFPGNMMMTAHHSTSAATQPRCLIYFFKM